MVVLAINKKIYGIDGKYKSFHWHISKRCSASIKNGILLGWRKSNFTLWEAIANIGLAKTRGEIGAISDIQDL